MLKGIAVAGVVIVAVAAAPAASASPVGGSSSGRVSRSSSGPVSGSASGPVCDGQWHIQRTTLVPKQHPGQVDYNELDAVAALSPSDQWSVGTWDQYPEAYIPHTLAEHSSGNQWTRFPSPNLAAPLDSSLFGIDAISAKDIWAVGGPTIVQPYHGLVEHWNGTSWSIVPAAAPPGVFYGVAAAGPRDIWAVGTVNFPGPVLIDHFNGHTWTAAQLPFNGWLQSVTALAPNDVWAAGLRWARNGAESPLTMHFDGHSWTVVASPKVLPGRPEDQAWLVSVSGTGPHDVWAAGFYGDVATGPVPHTLIEHWNGKQWTVMPSPDPGTDPHGDALWGITSVSPHDAWAVGSIGGAIDAYTTTKPLIEHWNGTTWSQLPAPGTGQLRAVAAQRSGHGVTAVGLSTASSAYVAPLAEHTCPG